MPHTSNLYRLAPVPCIHIKIIVFCLFLKHQIMIPDTKYHVTAISAHILIDHLCLSAFFIDAVNPVFNLDIEISLIIVQFGTDTIIDRISFIKCIKFLICTIRRQPVNHIVSAFLQLIYLVIVSKLHPAFVEIHIAIYNQRIIGIITALLINAWINLRKWILKKTVLRLWFRLFFFIYPASNYNYTNEEYHRKYNDLFFPT